MQETVHVENKHTDWDTVSSRLHAEAQLAARACVSLWQINQCDITSDRNSIAAPGREEPALNTLNCDRGGGEERELCVCVRAGDSFNMRRWDSPFGLLMKRQKKRLGELTKHFFYHKSSLDRNFKKGRWFCKEHIWLSVTNLSNTGLKIKLYM